MNIVRRADDCQSGCASVAPTVLAKVGWETARQPWRFAIGRRIAPGHGIPGPPHDKHVGLPWPATASTRRPVRLRRVRYVQQLILFRRRNPSFPLTRREICVLLPETGRGIFIPLSYFKLPGRAAPQGCGAAFLGHG